MWQGPDVEAISAAVESTIGDHCTSTLFPVGLGFRVYGLWFRGPLHVHAVPGGCQTL